MPPKHLETHFTEEQADLTRPDMGTIRFQWHRSNPKVTVLSFDAVGDCENVRHVPAEHARYLWSKLIKQGWIRNV